MDASAGQLAMTVILPRESAAAAGRADPLLALLTAARRGDERARHTLLERMQDPWYRVCLALLANADAAREATQEAAVRTLRRLGRYSGRHGATVQTWATGIAINVCRESRRRQRRARCWQALDAAAVPAHPADAPDARACRAEQAQRMRQLIAALPQRQREAIVLRYYEQMNLQQTAAAMGCAVGTVKATTAQALRQLRRQWSNDHDQPQATAG